MGRKPKKPITASSEKSEAPKLDLSARIAENEEPSAFGESLRGAVNVAP